MVTKLCVDCGVFPIEFDSVCYIVHWRGWCVDWFGARESPRDFFVGTFPNG